MIGDAVKRRFLFFLTLALLPFFAFYVFLFYQSPALPGYEGEYLTLTGTIKDKVCDEDGSLTTLLLKGEQGFKVYVSGLAPDPCAFRIGSVVSVTGSLHSFRAAGNPGEFDSFCYNETRGYSFYLTASSIKVLKVPGFSVPEGFWRLRMHFCGIVRENCPLEYGTINTLLFGDKTDLDEERKNLYKMAGLSHFLVISGLHVSVAGGGIYMGLRRLGAKRSPAAVFGICFVLCYGCLVGFSVSVMRAVIMYFLRLLADITKRTYDLLTALSIAALVTLVRNPLWIRDSAFLYSYGAVLVTGLYMTYLRHDAEAGFFRRVYERSGPRYRAAKLRQAAAVPLLIYLALLPISLYFQSYSNLLSVPLNLFLGLLTSPVLFCGAAGFFFGLCHLTFLSGLADFFCALMLKLIDSVASLASSFRQTRIIYQPDLWQIFLYYAVFLLVLLVLPHFLPAVLRALIMTSMIFAVGTPLTWSPSVTVLDVDQGDCIVLRTGKHKAVLSDCGSTGRSDIAAYVVIPYLMSQGITEIEDIYISHGDADHMNGVTGLIGQSRTGNVKVDRIVFPKLPQELFNDNLTSVYESALASGIPMTSITRGGSLSYGEFTLTCLSPSVETLTGDTNRDSLVLWVSYGSFDALLTGDATSETEGDLVLPEGVTFEMLKVGHHGSKYSSSEEFLKALAPDIAVISVGSDNSYGHPHADTLKRLQAVRTKIYRTDTMGAVTVRIHENRFQCNSFFN